MPSPQTVGTVETRMSIRPFLPVNSMWPSWGTNRSAMFMFAMILMREMIAACSRFEEGAFSTRMPSIRYLILTSRSNGSMWISLARDSIASKMIKFTKLTRDGSRASSDSLAGEKSPFSESSSARCSAGARLSSIRATLLP